MAATVDGKDGDEHGPAAEDYLPPDRTVPPGVEAVEVEGEPVSRFEACRMGLFAETPQPRRAPAVSPEAEPGEEPAPPVPPPRASADRETRIGTAEKLLDEGNAEDALALAQEVVREHPAMAAPRVVMARAFMGLGDYAKAQAVLTALPAPEQTIETLYYRGLASATIGRHENAARLLESALNLPAGDPEIRARAGELLARLRCAGQPAAKSASGPGGPAAATRPRPLPRKGRRGRRAGAFPVFLALVIALACAAGLYFGLKHFMPELFHHHSRRLPGLWTGENAINPDDAATP